MIDVLHPDTAQYFPHVREFFLARQPILNREQQLIAYELLFRNAAIGPANVTDDLAATAAVIANASHLGMDNVIGDVLGFVNVDAAVLMSDIIQFLPREKIVLEIIETVKVTPELIKRITELVAAGFRFALDDVIADSHDLQQLLPLVEIIKLDLQQMSHSTLVKLAPQFKRFNKKLLAEKVETLHQFQTCLDLGFDYFQGYYFAKPSVMTGKKLSPSQLTIMQLMMQINMDADSAEIEHSIKQNVSLGFHLLRLVNTPLMAARCRIDSLNQALAVLGRQQLQRWLQILLYAEQDKNPHLLSPLLILATTRGKLLELIAQKLKPGNSNIANTAFTVGIMSLMDTLFNWSMTQILEQIAVVDEVSDALLYRKGFYGDLLKISEYLERIGENTPLLLATLEKLQLSSDDLYEIEMTTFEWVNQITAPTRSNP